MDHEAAIAAFGDEAKFALLDQLPEMVIVIDETTRIRWCNQTTLHLLGYVAEDIIGAGIFDFVHPDDLNYMLASWEKRGDNPGESGLIVQGRCRNHDGSWRAAEVVGLSLFEDEHVRGMVVTARDLAHQAALADSPARLRSLVDRTTDVLLLLDVDGLFVYANRRLTALLGYDSDRIVGDKWTDILDPDDFWPAVGWFDQLVAAGDGATSRVQVRVVGPRGSRLEVELHGTNQVGDPLINGVIVSVRDIGEIKTMQRILEERNERLAHAATHDQLTGLLNRSAFVGAVDEAITDRRDAAGRAGTDDAGDIVVLFCDLDDFKVVNDNHGHQVGDRVLEEIAERLGSTVRTSDVLARYGGDEFTVLLGEDAPVPVVSALVARLTNALTEPLLIGGITTGVGVSIGVSRLPIAEADVDSLLSEADASMYERKRARRHDDA